MCMCDSGWLHCQRHRLPDDLTSQAGGHQSQQAWHEPHALRCQGELERSPGRWERFQREVTYPPLNCFYSPQQAEEIDAELLTFPSQLEHIGAASRWWSPALTLLIQSCLTCCVDFVTSPLLRSMLLSYRICKEEVIADFYNKVKKIETLKLQSSSQPGFLQDMKTFLMVKASSRVPPASSVSR